MRSTRQADDLSTAARIRDAAIVRFGRDGFGAGLRAVAADAGVTAGLVVHHFGSKDGLRAACDAHVLGVIRSEKLKVTTRSLNAITQLADVEQYAPYALYSLRSMQAGGELGRQFVDRMAEDALEYLEVGVQAGTIKPSRDPVARARYLTYHYTGYLLLWMSLYGGPVEIEQFRTELRRLADEVTLPALELFTDGLLTDRTMLDDYVEYVNAPPKP
ncbi:TetR family transcriptional regulator [Kribbella sp. NPDC048915]|uniref:TetR/AcrR family transcriptional regulator n=1 Tax=Kribbella sp. NPDC048915 TaxID=3155148 RepID=UPI0033E1E4DA